VRACHSCLSLPTAYDLDSSYEACAYYIVIVTPDWWGLRNARAPCDAPKGPNHCPRNKKEQKKVMTRACLVAVPLRPPQHARFVRKSGHGRPDIWLDVMVDIQIKTHPSYARQLVEDATEGPARCGRRGQCS